MGEVDEELAELILLAREHLLFEQDLGSRGLPDPPPHEGHTAAPRAEALGHALRADLAEELRREGGRAPSEAAAPQSPRREASPTASAPTASAAPSDRRARLSVVQAEVSTCTKCRLHAGRTQTVFARGNPDARLVFVGEGPGFNEDKQGLPFVGKAGQLLDKMIAAMGFAQDEVYICNVVKCRPPENRTPNPDEAAACMPFLRAQLEVIAPEIIVALGRCAAENLGVAREGQRWRGAWGTFDGVRVMPTYHPAYLLRNPEHKRPVWQDLQEVVAAMGRELPAARR